MSGKDLGDGENRMAPDDARTMLEGAMLVQGMSMFAHTCEQKHVHAVVLVFDSYIAELGVTVPVKLLMDGQMAKALTGEMAEMFMASRGIDADMLVDGIRQTSPDVWAYMKSKGMVPEGWDEEHPVAADADGFDFGRGVE